MWLSPSLYYFAQGDDMLHGPATPVGKDPAGPYKQRLGIWMFTFYALFYAGFVAINLLNPLAMGIILFALGVRSFRIRFA